MLIGGYYIFNFVEGVQTICNCEIGALVLVLFGVGDLECMRYVSKLLLGVVCLEYAQFG